MDRTDSPLMMRKSLTRGQGKEIKAQLESRVAPSAIALWVRRGLSVLVYWRGWGERNLEHNSQIQSLASRYSFW